ncbi:MAG: HAD family hydrolase [Pirellulaceae bacterium]|jgi:phosphoglycolate phosphatase|nr:HAD family hydrolase [Pirellulaceae bacterium]MDP7304904.1 HAD family hydrolase [Pirellulaceae bacterium]HJN08389.1 HAD family hydrolase [Pirellulaceae bacterium]
MEYSAVIFDLDGTLLDTLADIADAANRVLVSRQLPTHDLPAYRHFVGNGVELLMQRAMPPEHRDAETIASSSAQFRRVYCDTWNLSTCPYPGIRELLDMLTQRQVQMAVLSNKPHANTIVCVDEFFDASTFAIVYGQRDDIPCKPDPAAALEISRAFEISPSMCLFVGDSDVDMQTAVNAGMTGIGVTWGFRSRAELLDSRARLAIDHPLDLLGIS